MSNGRVPKCVFDLERLENVLDYESVMDEIAGVLKDEASVSPGRLSLTRDSIWLGVMPSAGMRFQAVKIVGVYPGNPARGLPLVRGVLVVLDEATGEPLLITEAGVPTGYRTAAASCLALRLLGFREGMSVSLIGAGYQGWHHARCLLTSLGAGKLKVFDERRDQASRLAQELNVEVVENIEEAVNADAIVTATTSNQPIITSELINYVKRVKLIASIGAPHPIVEVDPELIKDAGCILVDTRRGFWEESGEARLLGGDVEDLEIVELAEILRGSRSCKSRGVRIYKSVGNSLFDLAVGIVLARRLSEGLLD